MADRLARNVAIAVGLAGALLALFELAGLPVLPADASPGPVIVAAVILAVTAALLEGVAGRTPTGEPCPPRGSPLCAAAQEAEEADHGQNDHDDDDEHPTDEDVTS